MIAVETRTWNFHLAPAAPFPFSLSFSLLSSTITEFIEVEKKESALECLNDVIHSKKHRQTWTTTHEQIMKLFVELCVDLQRSAFAKDGLYQYRNICREVSLHSFEVVSPLICLRLLGKNNTKQGAFVSNSMAKWVCWVFQVVKHFLTLASDRANAAREESEQAVLQEVEDLDVIMTPEKSVAHLSPSTYGLIYCSTEFESAFHAFIVCWMLSASLPAVPHSLLSKSCAPCRFHAFTALLVPFLCVSVCFRYFTRVFSLLPCVCVSVCVFPLQSAVEYSEWGGGEGEIGPRAAGSLGQVPLGVLPQHDGATQEQQHH